MTDQSPDRGERKPGGWQCPTCGRHIPGQIDVCRCGSERKRLEALGYQFESAPPGPTRRVVRPRAQSRGLAGTLIGYQPDTDLPAGWRVTLKALAVMAIVALGAALVRFTHTEPRPVRGNVEILQTLDGFTRTASADTPNAIPAFIASHGRLGVLSAAGMPDDPVRSIRESDLGEGVCTQSVARQVRHEYPGYYEQWPDDRLERMFLDKYPQYTSRVCVLSVRFDAPATDIVKYELKPLAVFVHSVRSWLVTLVLTAAFALVCVNLYYRVIIGYLVTPLEA